MISPRQRAAVLPQPIKLPKLILAEGDTPTHFFEALLREMGIADTIEIHNYGGDTELGKYLRTIAASAEFRLVKSLLVSRDADDDPGAARKSVQSVVQSANLDSSIKIQFAILPGDQSAGMIETLCLASVDTKPHFRCVTEFINCVESVGVELPAGAKRAKNLARAYLATTTVPEKFPGTAAYHNVWPFDHPAFAPLKAVLANM